jgi:DAK2 domain fusion protein YloV
VLELASGALVAIEANRARIDDLNVYPVPDGDTGTNLALTVRAIVDALEQSQSDDRAELAHQVSRAALMGARGNSGVILSQIVRGAAEAIRDSNDLAPALRGASDAAYRAVRTPVEGTMLTAIRELAEEAEGGGDLRAIVARGDDCVVRTRQMLPVLTEAGVVDAGAAGLLEIVRGIASVLTGEPVLPAPLPGSAGNRAESVPTIDLMHQELSRYRYCTVFVVEGDRLDADALERELDGIGDSLLVVGDPTALKIHVHTDDPGRALSFGVARGTIAGVEIANMHVQTLERHERLLQAVPPVAADRCALVAVASGAGNRRLLETLGAEVVDGGRTMNPSTSEILDAVEAADAAEVIVLPNNRNVVMTAEHAAAGASKPVLVLPTVTLQAGLAAAVAFDPDLSAEENLESMEAAAADVLTGAVTIASRDIETNGLAIRKGAWLGLADGDPIAGGDTFDEVACQVVDRLLAEPRGLLTLLTGDKPQPLDGLLAELAAKHPDVELEVHEGGQANYPLFLAAE